MITEKQLKKNIKHLIKVYKSRVALGSKHPIFVLNYGEEQSIGHLRELKYVIDDLEAALTTDLNNPTRL